MAPSTSTMQPLPTVCADCGASFPLPPAGGGASGYAITSVARFPSPRIRVLRDDRTSFTTVTSAPGFGIEFPGAVYDVEGKRAEHDAKRELPQRRICYACSAVLESETMTARGRGCLYLSREQQNVPPLRSVRGIVQQSRHEPGAWWRVSGWPGVPAYRIVGSVRCGWGYGFGRRYPVQTFRFAGPDGYVWSGRCAGDMQLARCKRTKERIK